MAWDYAAFRAELDAHYARGPANIRALDEAVERRCGAHPEWLPWQRKAALYEVAASLAEPAVSICSTKATPLRPMTWS